ncbi:unnamed protein product [Cylindrotheca closterium]|uniref:Uncharacterized protein n=1 Tax=Cylindrotheca closterium TaxID=2856 RepID=A0AAD2JNP8_9STRA|nr:unnamed protein product [Cylindrotheca closterium]
MKSPPRATVTGTNHHAPPTPAATNNNGNQDTSQFILQTILQSTESMMKQMQATAERLAQLEPDLHGARDRPIQYNQGATPNGGEDEVPRGPNGEILINHPPVRIGQVDSSKDNKDGIHGLFIFDSQIDRAMMPEALLRSQYKGLYNVMNDIASLPGRCSPKRGGGDVDMNTDTTDIMQQFLETVESSKNPSMKTTITDIHYPKTSRHGLSLIKSEANLFEAASTNMAEDKELTSRNQRLRVQFYLHDRGYMKDFIDNYLERSLLCLIIQETLTNYTTLINKIRQKRIDGMSNAWKGSETYLLLSHHSKELLRIRVHCTSKRLLLFQNYIYLCDAQAKNFNSNKIMEKTVTNVREENCLFQEALDSRLEALVEERLAEHLAKNKKGARKGNNEPKCSWCHNRDLHIALGIEHTPKACTLRSHPTTWAKKACRKVLQTYKADPKRPIAEIVKEVSEGWKKESPTSATYLP